MFTTPELSSSALSSSEICAFISVNKSVLILRRVGSEFSVVPDVIIDAVRHQTEVERYGVQDALDGDVVLALMVFGHVFCRLFGAGLLPCSHNHQTMAAGEPSSPECALVPDDVLHDGDDGLIVI